jgi:hypothetical protein
VMGCDIWGGEHNACSHQRRCLSQRVIVTAAICADGMSIAQKFLDIS